jgi:dolichol-phosphate mannosyltransferase
MTTFACIATRHEAATIGPLVAALRAQGLIVIVEDESDDATTYRAAQEAGAQANWTPGGYRTGLGPSLMRAWRQALHQGATTIVQLDAGGSHDPAQVGLLVGALQHFECNAALSTRFDAGGRYIGRPWRAQASRLAGALCHRRAQRRYGFALHGQLRDWTSGFRAFTPGTVAHLLGRVFHFTGHAWQIEVVDMLLKSGARTIAVPITYTAGRSSLTWRGCWEAYLAWRMI